MVNKKPRQLAGITDQPRATGRHNLLVLILSISNCGMRALLRDTICENVRTPCSGAFAADLLFERPRNFHSQTTAVTTVPTANAIAAMAAITSATPTTTMA